MPVVILSLIAVLLFGFNVLVRRGTPETGVPSVSRQTFGDLVTEVTSPTPTPSPAPTPTPTSIPRPRDPRSESIECVGPDNVHFKTSRKACDDLNDFWKNPHASPVPASGFKREKIDEHTTVTWLPADDRMSTTEELFVAMNDYRQAHGIAAVARNDTLCSIAQKRAEEQKALGSIDGHAGFPKYAQEQREFSYLTEVLFGGQQPQSGVHIVEYGWDQSLTGHREAIQDRSMSHGCAGVTAYFAVFIFGMK